MNEIKQKVKGLTKSLSPLEARIKIFYFVRDIPYFVSSNQNPVDAIKNNKANCGQKARLLALMLNELGIKTKLSSIQYHFDLVPLPKYILKLIQMKKDYHLALFAKIKNKWAFLDATADYPLKRKGFIVNEWDGFSNTKSFVIPIKTSGKREKDKNFKKWLKDNENINRTKLKLGLEKYNNYLEKIRIKT